MKRHKVTRTLKSGKTITYWRGDGSSSSVEDITRHPKYMDKVAELSDKYHEDLGPDGSFPKDHEATAELKNLEKSLKRESVKKGSPSPKKSVRSPKSNIARRRRGKESTYRIIGTNIYRKG